MAQVERAQPKGDTGIARPWSKHSEGSSRAQKLAEASARKEGKTKEKAQAVQSAEKATGSKQRSVASDRTGVEKEEFMAALKKRSEARFWDNDDASLEQSKVVANEGETSEASSEQDDTDSVEAEEDSTARDVAMTGNSREGPAKGQGKSAVSDMDWLRSKVGDQETNRQEASGGESEEDNDGQEAPVGKASGKAARGGSDKVTVGGQARGSPEGREGGGLHPSRQADSDDGNDEEESGLSVGRLFVRNLPYTCTEDDLRDLFGSFGALSEVHLPVDDVKKVGDVSCTVICVSVY